MRAHYGFFAGLLLASASARAEPDLEHKGPPPSESINVNMTDADLHEAVKMAAEWTGRRFIVGGKVRTSAKLTIVSPKPVTVSEAYEAFVAVLRSNGLALIDRGRYQEIVASDNVAREPTAVLGVAEPVPATERFVTRLYRPKHVEANAAAQVLESLKSSDGGIQVHADLLIITDTGIHIRRLMRLLEEIDTGGAAAKIFVQPIHHVAAGELARVVNELLALEQGSSSRIVADDINRQLVIVSTEEDYQRVLTLIERLDLPPGGDRELHVLRLQNASCMKVSATLSGVTPSSAGAKSGKAAADAGLFEGEVKLSCDEDTNALVAFASLRDFVELRRVVDELDQPRRQVFIEAVIMDVKADDSDHHALGFHGGAPFDAHDGKQGLFFAGSNGALSTASPSSLEALAIGVRGPKLDLPGVSIPEFGVALSAVAGSSDANLLATPHVLATDNITAEISIGDNIALQVNAAPLPTFQDKNVNDLVQQVSAGAQSERKDVGIMLRITPHLNESNQVRLEIEQEFSSANPKARLGTLGTIDIAKRTTSTTIVVADQQTAVIGGLTREERINIETKVPVLGDIPLLGLLFRDEQEITKKTNLLLVLTPHIIRNQDDLRRIFERKMEQRQEFLERQFIFDETLPWEPLPDYSRQNGLVEHIRQEQLTGAREEARLAALATDTRTHEPVQPIALPAMASEARTAPASAPPAKRSPAPKSETPERATLKVPGSRPPIE